MHLRHWLAVLSLILLTHPVGAAEPWRLPDWSARAVVEIPAPSAEANVDAAGVKILCQGRAKPDGADFRVLDAAGKPVPFQLDFHDADHYALLTFKVDNPKQKFYVYFGNPKAKRRPSRRRTSPHRRRPADRRLGSSRRFRLSDNRPASRRRRSQGT